jgi:hypothetical protein
MKYSNENKSLPVFGTGLARSGGGLYSMCLSTHEQIMVACCPNIELFRSYRNAVVRSLGSELLSVTCPPNAAFQDCYGCDNRIAILDHLLTAADLSLPFAEQEWHSFLQTSISRGDLETRDLTPHFRKLKGKDYRAIFSNLLEVIASARQCSNRRWLGFHETWILDFFPVLAREFPDARFLVMFRDPRATVNSMLGVQNIDPLQVAQVLSYVRHWRKYAALAQKFSSDPLFTGRLHITAHELLLTNTEEALRDICKSLELELDERMLDTQNFFNFATNSIWGGNSSFEGKTEGFVPARATRWREKLDETIWNAIEYLCGPDLEMVGYPTFTTFADPQTPASPEVTQFLLDDHSSFANWRSDLGDPLRDLGLEAVRRQLLGLPQAAKDRSLLRKCFLFEQTYEALRSGNGPLLPNLAAKLSHR